MLKRYVDDINTALPPAPPGSRYIQGEIVIVPEEVEADLSEPADKRTMMLLIVQYQLYWCSYFVLKLIFFAKRHH